MPLPVCLCVAGCVILCTLTISFISSSCRRHRRRQHHPHHRLSLGLLDYTKHFSKGDDDEPSGNWKKRKKKKGCVTFFCSLFVHQTKKVTLSFPQLKHDLQISSICLVFFNVQKSLRSELQRKGMFFLFVRTCTRVSDDRSKLQTNSGGG